MEYLPNLTLLKIIFRSRNLTIFTICRRNKQFVAIIDKNHSTALHLYKEVYNLLNKHIYDQKIDFSSTRNSNALELR